MRGLSLLLFVSSASAFLSILGVSATEYLLYPKDTSTTSMTSMFNTQEFYTFYSGLAERYGLEEIANFGKQFPIYTTDRSVVFANRMDIGEFYDIEENREVRISDSRWTETRRSARRSEDDDAEVPWHLTRVTQKKSSAGGVGGGFPYAESGSCHRNRDVVINSYIVDTGIDITHPEFEGRAQWSANFADDKDTDCNNHGTHVAGLVGSRSYGVCVDANLFAVKVLDCEGSGSLSGVVQGIEWVYKQHIATSRKANDTRVVKSLINMSLGGGYSPAINRAVEACVKKEPNFYIVVAAGNENSDSCRVSPASVKGILTVMASDKDDNRAWFSNWGACSNVYAPGVDVLSTIPDEGTAKYSGTSMASPVMAGVLNHYIDMFPDQDMGSLMKTVQKLATKNVITGDKPKTVNLLAYLRR